MPLCSPVYADVIVTDGRPYFGSVLNREDDIAVTSPRRRVDITVNFDDIALGLHDALRSMCVTSSSRSISLAPVRGTSDSPVTISPGLVIGVWHQGLRDSGR